MAGAHLAQHHSGVPRRVAIPITARQPVASFLPDMIDPATLRMLALSAVDAAKQAGATYADVRVATIHSLLITPGYIPNYDVTLEYVYGIRACVQGGWHFAFGTDPTQDGLTQTARDAVNTARGLAKFAPPRDWMTMPPTQGEWTTPVKIDPLSVSPDAYAKFVGACSDAAKRVKYGDTAKLMLSWQVETRTFASTENSLVTQHVTGFRPEITAVFRWPETFDSVTIPVPIPARSGGFECVEGGALQEQIKTTTEECASIAALPEANAEIGRYDVVCDGFALGHVAAETLGCALELDRVLGHEADGVGTSFLGPISDVLGKPLFSPHLSLRTDRSVPQYNAVRWDDEGVPVTPFPLIDRGTVVNYFATRRSASALSGSNTAPHSTQPLSGSAIAWGASTSPVGAAAQLTVDPNPAHMPLSALLSQLSDGLFVRNVFWQQIHADQQLSSGAFVPELLLEVKRGTITRRLNWAAVQFSTRKFWKNIQALGDASTCRELCHEDVRGESIVRATIPIQAPAAHIQQVDVMSMAGYGK